MQNQQKNNLCSKFIKSSLSDVFCKNCGREEWNHPKEKYYKIKHYVQYNSNKQRRKGN